MAVPTVRLRSVNDVEPRSEGDYVLYWMIANRRTSYNYSLDRALEHARSLGKPLLVFEALRVGYRWASDRIHRFVLDGMADSQAAFERAGVTFIPYVEPTPGAGSGLLTALGKQAAVVVTDDFPCFFLPAMVRAAGEQLRDIGVGLEAVDSNGLYPITDADRAFPRAHSFRRHLQKRLPAFIEQCPKPRPLKGYTLGTASVPKDVEKRWLTGSHALDGDLAGLPIDHGVRRAPIRGGETSASKCMADFLADRLAHYGEDRNHPDRDGASGLSPYLHFGHISSHEVFWAIAQQEKWDPTALGAVTGSREGWWGMSAASESFLDEIITWREVGYNMCALVPNYAAFESLPDWARKTLAEHAGDGRPYIYSLEQFEKAQTHDDIWNAAQRQLTREGKIHNYLRMLWGKKILEWTPSPREALDVMIELNNKYALDGRNPNSYSGIFWVLGRYDRAWGPERPIYGKIRYMTSDSTRRKLRLKKYLAQYGSNQQLALGVADAHP